MAHHDELMDKLGQRISRRQALKAGGATAASFSLAGLLAACGSSGGSSASSSAASATAAGGSSTSSSSGGTLTIGVSGDPTTLDPAFGQSDEANEIIKNIYSQWVKYKAVDSGRGYMQADTAVEPEGLALKSYTQKGSTVIFEAKTGTLPSGAKLNADTFLYKVQRSLGLAAGSVFDFNVVGISKDSQVKQISDFRFEFELPHPSPILGPILRDQDAGIVDPGVIKAHATAKDKWAKSYVAQHGAPTGAYTVQSYTPGTGLTLMANPHYPGEAAKMGKVILQEVPTAADRALYLKEGQIDIAEGLSLDQIVSLKGASGVNVISVPSTSQDVFGFVMNKPPFNNVKLRQAVAYAIPYEQMIQSVYKGEASVAKGLWPERSVFFDKNVPYPYTYNTEKAKALLKEAGMASGFSFTCQLSSADDNASALAVPVQSALAAVGIQMKIDPIAPATFATNLSAKTPQAWIQSNLDFYVDDPYYRVYLFLDSKAVLNWVAFSNTQVDKIAVILSKTTDMATKKKLAGQIQQITNPIVPYISLGETNFLLPVRDNIEGFLYEPDGLLTYGAFSRKA